MFQISIIAFFLWASITGGQSEIISTVRSSRPRILGGMSSPIRAQPYIASLHSDGEYYCGGSIIAENLILTAAHCCVVPAQNITVRVGSSKSGSGGTLYKVEKLVYHENISVSSNGVIENDIALLQLESPIVFHRSVQPVSLSCPNETISVNVSATVAGWGWLTNEGKEPRKLHSTNVMIVSLTECNDYYKYRGSISRGQICAGAPGKNACRKDSGGPLIVNGQLAGIVSWGKGCSEKGYPTVFTDVSAYRDWIQKHASDSTILKKSYKKCLCNAMNHSAIKRSC